MTDFEHETLAYWDRVLGSRSLDVYFHVRKVAFTLQPAAKGKELCLTAS
jgi:hypothetical protein